MPVQTSYPGVYVEEIPSGVRAITGVATSITAFIGRARRGPLNNPVPLSSFGDFDRGFGGLWLVGPLGFAVRDFYLNGGSSGLVVRLFKTIASDATATTAATAVATAANGAGNTTVDQVLTAAQTAVAASAANAAEPLASACAAVVNAIAAVKAVGGDTATAKAAATAALTVTRTRFSLVTSDVVNPLALEAVSEGAWGNLLRVRIDHDTMAGDPSLFNLSIKDTGTGEIEVIRNLSTLPTAIRRVDKVLELESRLLRVPGVLGTAGKPVASAAVPAGGDPFALTTSFSPAGAGYASDGLPLTATEYSGNEPNKTGIYALAKADLFNLLVIPPFAPGVDVDKSLYPAVVAYVEKRRAMLLVDAPSGWVSKEDARTKLDSDVGISHRNAAVYFPRLRQPNPLKANQVETFAAAGTIAGVIARTDTERGIWKAPAGLDATLVGAPDLSVMLNDAENGELNPLGINCLRSMPPTGRIIWGARTLRGDDRLADDWKYIPVRRTALYIEESLFRGTQWVVFEPNDEPLWAQIRLNVGAFMHSLFRQGAFQGKTPKEAYFVKCDRETTTQDDVNKGVVKVVVGFAPLKPAEFVIIQLQQMAGQSAA